MKSEAWDKDEIRLHAMRQVADWLRNPELQSAIGESIADVEGLRQDDDRRAHLQDGRCLELMQACRELAHDLPNLEEHRTRTRSAFEGAAELGKIVHTVATEWAFAMVPHDTPSSAAIRLLDEYRNFLLAGIPSADVAAFVTRKASEHAAADESIAWYQTAKDWNFRRSRGRQDEVEASDLLDYLDLNSGEFTDPSWQMAILETRAWLMSRSAVTRDVLLEEHRHRTDRERAV